MAAIDTMMGRNNALLETPSLLLQAVVIPGKKGTEGALVESVAWAWFDIVEFDREVVRDD